MLNIAHKNAVYKVNKTKLRYTDLNTGTNRMQLKYINCTLIYFLIDFY